MFVFTQPLHNELDVTQGQFLSSVGLVWIQSFLGCLIKVKVHSLYYLYITGKRIDGFIAFLWGISMKGNANSFVQDLNSCHQFHVQQ